MEIAICEADLERKSLIVEVTLRNKRKSVLSRGPISAHIEPHIEIVNARLEQVPCTDRGHEMLVPDAFWETHHDRPGLQAGNSVDFRYQLFDCFDLSEPGPYALVVWEVVYKAEGNRIELRPDPLGFFLGKLHAPDKVTIPPFRALQIDSDLRLDPTPSKQP